MKMNKTINRSVLVLVAKQPYYDWGNSLDDSSDIDKFDECSSHLLDEGWSSTEAEEFLKLNFDELFQEQLHGMWTDESAWPQNRTWEMFNEWFDWHFSSMVWDIFADKKIVWEEW